MIARDNYNSLIIVVADGKWWTRTNALSWCPEGDTIRKMCFDVGCSPDLGCTFSSGTNFSHDWLWFLFRPLFWLAPFLAIALAPAIAPAMISAPTSSWTETSALAWCQAMTLALTGPVSDYEFDSAPILGCDSDARSCSGCKFSSGPILGCNIGSAPSWSATFAPAYFGPILGLQPSVGHNFGSGCISRCEFNSSPCSGPISGHNFSSRLIPGWDFSSGCWLGCGFGAGPISDCDFSSDLCSGCE